MTKIPSRSASHDRSDASTRGSNGIAQCCNCRARSVRPRLPLAHTPQVAPERPSGHTMGTHSVRTNVDATSLAGVVSTQARVVAVVLVGPAVAELRGAPVVSVGSTACPRRRNVCANQSGVDASQAGTAKRPPCPSHAARYVWARATPLGSNALPQNPTSRPPGLRHSFRPKATREDPAVSASIYSDPPGVSDAESAFSGPTYTRRTPQYFDTPPEILAPFPVAPRTTIALSWSVVGDRSPWTMRGRSAMVVQTSQARSGVADARRE
jgi:hypothetical protein